MVRGLALERISRLEAALFALVRAHSSAAGRPGDTLQRTVAEKLIEAFSLRPYKPSPPPPSPTSSADARQSP